MEWEVWGGWIGVGDGSGVGDVKSGWVVIGVKL